MIQRYTKGALIDRNIDGMLFRGIIESVSSINGTVRIRYIDDDNVEDHVPMEDIQMANPSEKCASSRKSNDDSQSLLKPLAGLIEDDSEIRKQHQPKVTLHGSEGDTSKEPVIIINGSESRLAVGAGLRALRYLKPV